MLESAAGGLSRYGYGNLVLEEVAREAGYTRGALYHQFKSKEDLAPAVLRWADETWQREVGELAKRQSDPVAALLAMARGHAILCRRDIARVAMALRVEFSGQDHPVGRELDRVQAGLVKRLVRLINAGRREGSIPAGPPERLRWRSPARWRAPSSRSPDKYRTTRSWLCAWSPASLEWSVPQQFLRSTKCTP